MSVGSAEILPSLLLTVTARTVTVRVTSRTRYERLAGLRSIRVGMTAIEAIVTRRGGVLVASLVERSGKNREDD